VEKRSVPTPSSFCEPDPSDHGRRTMILSQRMFQLEPRGSST
jgi:hypothetical protein